MFTLDKYVNMSLKADGRDVALGPDVVKSMSIIQSIHNTLPLFHATLHDIEGLHAKYNAFADGVKLEVNIGPGDNSSKATTFRRFNAPDISNGNGGDTVTISGQYDASAMRKLQTKSFSKMTSTQALQQVLGSIGLQFEGDPTNDKMTWLPNNKSIHQWIRHVADHGFVSKMSAMHLTMGGRGDGVWTMLYKDVIKAAQQSPIARCVTQGYASASDITILPGAAWRSHSGTLNNIGGYGGQTLQLSKNMVPQLFSQVQSLLSMNKLDMSSVVKSAVSQLPFHILPIDGGNTHANFAQAKHQNDRLKQTFTSFLGFITTDYTNLRVLDPVKVMQMQNGKLHETQSGNYIVHSRTQFVSGTMYREKIVLAAQGTNS
jgi:hypothetical protein